MPLAAPDQPIPVYAPIIPAEPAAIVAAFSPATPEAPPQPLPDPAKYATVSGTISPNMNVTMSLTGMDGGKPSFNGPSGETCLWTGSYWYFSDAGSAWSSFADVATPDLVPPGGYHVTTNPMAWRPEDEETGLPIFILGGFATAITTPPNTVAAP